MKWSNKAFTLIEILIVVVIIGILAGIAINRAGDTKNLGVINTAASNIKTLSNLRNSLLGLDKENDLTSGEQYIRPNTSFSLRLSANNQAGTIVFEYTAPAAVVGATATNSAISAQLNRSLVLPYDIFESMRNVRRNNVLTYSSGVAGSYGVMLYGSKLMYANIWFDPSFNPEASSVVISYVGSDSGGQPVGTWIITN
jgi:prepilin-type N-terminal cleavage/methylation domain-containing protein